MSIYEPPPLVWPLHLLSILHEEHFQGFSTCYCCLFLRMLLLFFLNLWSLSIWNKGSPFENSSEYIFKEFLSRVYFTRKQTTGHVTGVGHRGGAAPPPPEKQKSWKIILNSCGFWPNFSNRPPPPLSLWAEFSKQTRLKVLKLSWYANCSRG